MNLLSTVLFCLFLYGTVVSCVQVGSYADPEAHKSVTAYSGSTYGGAVWSQPEIQNYGSGIICNAGQTQPYISFTATFTTSEVQEIILNTYSSLSMKLFIYEGASVNFARPCVGLLAGQLGNGFGRLNSGPNVDDFVYFPAGTYTFIVSGSGYFAINIISPTASGEITSSSPFWNEPTIDNTLKCSVSTSSSVAFSTFTWKQGSSGLFDISTFFVNSTADIFWYPGVVLYAGSHSVESLQQDPCSKGIIDYASTSYFGASIFNANLTAGQAYTIAFSSRYPGRFARWGVDIVPTRLRFFNQNGFDQPYLSGSTCSDGYYKNTGWSANNYYAQTNGIYLLSVMSAPAPYAPTSLSMFLYDSITWDGSALPPPTCPNYADLVYSSSSYYSLTAMFDAQQSKENTLVVALPQQATPAQAYLLYAITGPFIGQRPAPSTTTGYTSFSSFSYASFSVTGSSGTTSDGCQFSPIFALVFASLLLLTIM